MIEFLEINHLRILGYSVMAALWALSLVALSEAGKMKYGIIPCIVNWITWKIGMTGRSECLEWFSKRKFYIFIHPIWMGSISLSLSLLSSLHDNMFHLRPWHSLAIAFTLWVFLTGFTKTILKYVRKHETHN